GGQFDFSSVPSGSGIFVYLSGKSSSGMRVVWLDNSGKMQPLFPAPGPYLTPRLSPDGQRLALSAGGDIAVYDLQRGTMTKITFAGHCRFPVWTPDGKHIAYVFQGAG